MTRVDRLRRVVKAYDVRGLVGEELDADVVHALGWASARVLGDGGGFVVGRDMRPSSPELCAVFTDGVRRAGVDVVDIGLASTDQLYFASGALDLPGAMFTASHNPAEYNGVKLCGRRATPVSIDSGLARIRDLAARAPAAGVLTGRLRRQDLLERFAAHVRTFVDLEGLDRVRVAVDAGNGMAGHVWPAVTAGLPVETDALYFELDGTFPNHPPDPLDERNLRDLKHRVVDRGHALGLAFDGDADRVFAVDENGRAVGASHLGAIVAERMLRNDPGAAVLYNLICSRAVPEAIERAGGRPMRSRVGHSFIKQRMAETDALMAIEHSGHYYFRDNFRADSGAIAALVVLESVARDGTGLSRLVAPFDRYVSSGEINFPVADPAEALGRVASAFSPRASIDDEDGLTVVLDDAWFNLRESNTEALLRLNVEAVDEPTMVATTHEVSSLVSGNTHHPRGDTRAPDGHGSE